MAKYSQTRKDREDERLGMMDRADRGSAEAAIRDDYSSRSSVPQRLIMHDVSCNVHDKDYSYDGTMGGMEEIDEMDVRKLNSQMRR